MATVVVVMLCADATGQTPASTADPPPPTDETLNRIRKALDRPAVLAVEPRQPDFRVEIVTDSLRDALFGPMAPNWRPPYGRAHYEFLQMVTPTAVRNPFSNSELAQVTATSLGFALAARGLSALVARQLEARRERRVRKIRLQIERELAELKQRQ